MPDESVIITVEGLDELLKRFGTSNKVVNAEIKKAMTKAVYFLQSKVAVYPAPPPMSTYRRTGTLGRSITSEIKGVGGEIRGIIGTAIPYAPYVIGPKQAAVHAGRWKRMTEHAKEQKGKVEEFFAKAGEEIVKELAG